MPINRRKVLGGAGLAGAAAATGVGVDRLVSGYRTDKEVSPADAEAIRSYVIFRADETLKQQENGATAEPQRKP